MAGVDFMISVIIPVYNNEKYIARCLDSLIQQTYSEFEALVINDGSKDNSGEIIQSYAEHDKRFRYFEQENQGVSVARNKGLDNAKGEYVLFLDGDDWLDNDVLERLHNEMTEHNLDCVSYMFRHVYEDGIPPNEDAGSENICYQLSSPSKAARFFDTVARSVFYTSQQHLFKRKIIEENTLRFSAGIRRGEDVLFAHMYAIYIRKGAILGKLKGYNYYHHAKSCMSVSSNEWNDVVLQNFKALRFFNRYLSSSEVHHSGKYFKGILAWETLLHMAIAEKNNMNDHRLKRFLKLKIFWYDIVWSLLFYGRFPRKILVLTYLLSRKSFRTIIGI